MALKYAFNKYLPNKCIHEVMNATKSWNLSLRSLEMTKIKSSDRAVMAVCLTNVRNLDLLVGGHMPGWKGVFPQTPLQLGVSLGMQFWLMRCKRGGSEKVCSHYMNVVPSLFSGNSYWEVQRHLTTSKTKGVQRKTERTWFSSGIAEMLYVTHPPPPKKKTA